MTGIIETGELKIDGVITQQPDDLDPTSTKILHTYYLTATVLEAIRYGTENDCIPDTVTQSYVDELEAAFRCCQRLREHPKFESFLTDVSALPDDLLVELRGSVVYVAQHFGIEIDLPSLKESDS